MTKSNKICRQYNADKLKVGLLLFLSDKRLHLCLLSNKVLNNDAMTPSKMEDHLRCHPDKSSKDLKQFQPLKDQLKKAQGNEYVLFDVTKR